MRFNSHAELEGAHAFLSASKYHWIRYDDAKMQKTIENRFAALQGTRLHAYAAEAIKLGRRQPRTNETINSYINDAIGLRMAVEVILFFSYNCFGTADAISFKDGILRIHDLKTGIHPSSHDQIFVYFALFCHEYRINPYDIKMIGRIYQLDQIEEFEGNPKEIRRIMDRMRHFDRMFDTMEEVMG